MKRLSCGDHALRARRLSKYAQNQNKLPKNIAMFGQHTDRTRSFQPRKALLVRYSLLRLLGCQYPTDQDSALVSEDAERLTLLWDLSSRGFGVEVAMKGGL